MRSFIPASTMTNFLLPPVLQYSTRVNSIAALAAMLAPGSRMSLRPLSLSSGTIALA